MRIASKPALLTVPVVMFITLVAVLALWANGTIGGSGLNGASSNASFRWNVEYWHENAAGDLLQYGKEHNTVTGHGVEDAMRRLIDASFDLGSAMSTGVLLEANAWDQIALLNATDADLTNGVLASLILTKVDGGNSNNSGQVAGTNKWNPGEGAYSDTANVTTDGKGEVTLKFLADGDPAAAAAMVLGRFATEDNSDDVAASVALANTDILAYIPITVDLNDTDTLTITWTIDINP